MQFLLQQPPPDTSAYMIAGYLVIFGVMALYVLSLFIRNRSLRQDIDMLKDIEKDKKS